MQAELVCVGLFLTEFYLYKVLLPLKNTGKPLSRWCLKLICDNSECHSFQGPWSQPWRKIEQESCIWQFLSNGVLPFLKKNYF